MRFFRNLFVNLSVIIGVSPLAEACSVCGFGQDGSQGAFLGTTAFMTLMPLGFAGISIYFIYHYLKN
ncbi:MAG: hypothetical protein D6797_06100 [Bdellovibrio sp.]|nr:MAG: hypothetical protein D6797_06100 [Bdellovibrio sp.]